MKALSIVPLSIATKASLPLVTPATSEAAKRVEKRRSAGRGHWVFNVHDLAEVLVFLCEGFSDGIPPGERLLAVLATSNDISSTPLASQRVCTKYVVC
jgi:hypothetical protein